MQFTLEKSSKDGQMQEYVNLEKDKINHNLNNGRWQSWQLFHSTSDLHINFGKCHCVLVKLTYVTCKTCCSSLLIYGRGKNGSNNFSVILYQGC